MGRIAVNGTEIHCELHGERGTPLVLMTGQGSGPDARAPLIDGLARHHRVLCYDPRGTGRSAPAPQGQSIETLALDVLALMDAVGIETAHLVGLSTGTGMATCVAARHPQRVRRLVLAAPWTHGDPDLVVLQGLRKAAAATMPPDHYLHLNALLIYPPDYRRAHFERFRQLAVAALARPHDAAGIAARLDAILAFDARPLYPGIRCPSLVVGARDDLVMPHWFAEAAAAAIPDARLEVFADGGHLFAETRTDRFLRLVLDFLAR